LTDAFTELGEAFSAHTAQQVEVLFNFAGSSTLAPQLNNGAPANIFASADEAQMRVVIGGGRVEDGHPQVFAHNQLAIIVPASNPANIQSLEDLAQDNIGLVLAAKGVPVRTYTDQLLNNLPAAVAEKIYANIVSEELSVRHVVARVALNEADAGIVYQSDITADVENDVQVITLPAEINPIASYLIAPVVDSGQQDLANAFIQFVLSEEGQTILSRYGLLPHCEEACE
ncbi:MAG: molybdate ABC transporter substrate-binding protein, partial [Chloroflexi bacterium]